MNLTDASRFLQDKLDASRNDLTFLGLSIPENIAVWAGPLAIAFLLAYLLSHLKHVRRISEIEAAKVFPWIGFFSNNLGRAITYASIGIMPLAAEVALLLRSGHWPAATTVLGLVLTIASSAASALLLVEIHMIRRKL